MKKIDLAIGRLKDQSKIIEVNGHFYLSQIYDCEYGIAKDIKRLLFRDKETIKDQDLSVYIGIVEKNSTNKLY